MAKELMEIGGFITEGAEIVNHDASLSGNGTVDSPLGLNETVLWDGDASTNITLSESASNFEYLKVEFRTNDNIQFFDFIKPEISATFTLMGKFFWVAQNMTYLKMSTFAMNDARTTINVLGGSELQFGSNYGREVGNKLSLLKIVGINRIANN